MNEPMSYRGVCRAAPGFAQVCLNSISQCSVKMQKEIGHGSHGRQDMQEYCKYLQYGRRKGLRLKEASIFITHRINIDSLFPTSCFHKAFFIKLLFLEDSRLRAGSEGESLEAMVVDPGHGTHMSPHLQHKV